MAMEWTNNHDIALAREVLLLEPYRHKARTVERGKVWQKVADNLNSHAILRFLVTKKSVREHLKLLLDKYRARMQKERRDMVTKQEEQKARREGHERQTRPYELALANQQQQQQQSNQLMSLMLGLMQQIAEKRTVNLDMKAFQRIYFNVYFRLLVST